MTTLPGLPPAVASLPGMPLDRPPSAAALQARQAEAANDRTIGAGDAPVTENGVTGPVGLDRMRGLQDRRLSQEPPPSPDAPAGPPPTFSTTPLEKLRYPPSPLQELARHLHEPQEAATRELAASFPPSEGAKAPGGDGQPGPEPSRAKPLPGGYGTQADTLPPEGGGLNIRR